MAALRDRGAENRESANPMLHPHRVTARRRFGRKQQFELENLGSEPVLSDFHLHNPESGTRYRVAIRGRAPEQNFCTCPDYATNHLGACKHIEFTLAKLEAKRGGKAALARGFEPPYSEI